MNRVIYQKLLIGRDPFYIKVEEADSFADHCHPELELSYCLSGSYEIVIEKKKYRLNAGDLAFIPPMTAHEYPESTVPKSERLIIEVGPRFLTGYFDHFKKLSPKTPVVSLKGDSSDEPALSGLVALLNDTAALSQSDSALSALLIKSNLYRISAVILSYLLETGKAGSYEKGLHDTARIEKALEIIYDRYHTQLDLDTVCAECGYSKSNFCRVFKKITGSTFHNVLNSYRIEMACLYLTESSLSAESIASQVGFSDAKSFCRTFKNITGETPGSYRKKNA